MNNQSHSVIVELNVVHFSNIQDQGEEEQTLSPIVINPGRQSFREKLESLLLDQVKDSYLRAGLLRHRDALQRVGQGRPNHATQKAS